MTPRMRIELRMSEVRQRLNEIAALEGDDFTDDVRTEADTLGGEYRDLETRYRSAIIADGDDGETTTEGDGDDRDRIELRQRASLGRFLLAALRGRSPGGAEAELQTEAGVDGIPLELWDVPTETRAAETRADAPTGTPSTVGVNLDAIRPAVFAQSVLPRLGVEMPRVESDTYASATITTSLTAGSHKPGSTAEATAAAFTVSSVTPKRISARMSIRIEDVAAVGQANFEAVLRENLSLVLSDALDKQGLNGAGGNSGADLMGLFARLTAPTDPTDLVDWEAFAAAHADGVDGLWSNTIRDVGIVVGPRHLPARGQDIPERRRHRHAGRTVRRRVRDGAHRRVLDEQADARRGLRHSTGHPLPAGPEHGRGRRCDADRRLPALERGRHR